MMWHPQCMVTCYSVITEKEMSTGKKASVRVTGFFHIRYTVSALQHIKCITAKKILGCFNLG